MYFIFFQLQKNRLYRVFFLILIWTRNSPTGAPFNLPICNFLQIVANALTFCLMWHMVLYFIRIVRKETIWKHVIVGKPISAVKMEMCVQNRWSIESSWNNAKQRPINSSFYSVLETSWKIVINPLNSAKTCLSKFGLSPLFVSAYRQEWIKWMTMCHITNKIPRR